MPHSLMEYYRAIEDSSEKMLNAAREEDWNGVVRFEGVCAVLIEQLRECARHEHLDAQAQKEKAQIMRRILMNDAQIRRLAEPWLAHCEQLLPPVSRTLH